MVKSFLIGWGVLILVVSPFVAVGILFGPEAAVLTIAGLLLFAGVSLWAFAIGHMLREDVDWCRVGIHKYERGVTGFVDRCYYCGKTRDRTPDWRDY